MKVYKASKNAIITLELLPHSKTNEKRVDIVNSDYAKYRTNKALVVSIINPITNIKLTEDRSIYDNNFVYRVGEIVIEKYYNEDINDVCIYGIHYFKTYEAALSWYYEHHDKKDGNYIGWYDNGRKYYESNYVNGKKHGKQYRWYNNGQLNYEYNYIDGKKHGEQYCWYDNGFKRYECNYIDGEKHGKQHGWFFSGRKEYEVNYFYGKLHGKQKYWSDQNIIIEENYVLDVKK